MASGRSPVNARVSITPEAKPILIDIRTLVGLKIKAIKAPKAVHKPATKDMKIGYMLFYSIKKLMRKRNLPRSLASRYSNLDFPKSLWIKQIKPGVLLKDSYKSMVLYTI